MVPFGVRRPRRGAPDGAPWPAAKGHRAGHQSAHHRSRHLENRPRILIPYFGSLPEWFPLFAFTAGRQSGFEWRIYTDDVPTYALPENVRCFETSLESYRAKVSDRLGLADLDFQPYKLCDFKPFLGHVHRDELEGADYWGFGDLDLLVGDLGRFYGPPMAKGALLISSHEDQIGGHLCLLRNDEAVHRRIFEIRDWERELRKPEHKAVDEYHLTEVFYPLRQRIGWWHAERFYRYGRRLKLISGVNRGRFCEELFTTPLSDIPWTDGSLYWDHPLEWTWRDGHIRASGRGLEVPYLHFMNYKSQKWLAYNVRNAMAEGSWQPTELPEGCEDPTVPPWAGLDRLVTGDMSDPSTITVSPRGIETT